MDRDVPHGPADPRVQGTLELFIASNALLFAVSQWARRDCQGCPVDVSVPRRIRHLAGQQIRYQIVNLEWTIQRPIGRAHFIAPRPDLQQLDRQLYARRFWHTLANALTNPMMNLYQCSAFGFRVVCAQCGALTSVCSQLDNILCLRCTPVDLICRTCVVRRRMQQEDFDEQQRLDPVITVTQHNVPAAGSSR